MELITTFEQACEKKGYDPKTILPDVSHYPEQHQNAIIATAKLFIVNEVLNTDDNGNTWKPDWNNYNENKYYAWFDLETYEKGSSPGFRFDGPGCDRTNSTVGSRLCFKSEELCIYAAKQFIELYKDLFTA